MTLCISNPFGQMYKNESSLSVPLMNVKGLILKLCLSFEEAYVTDKNYVFLHIFIS